MRWWEQTKRPLKTLFDPYFKVLYPLSSFFFLFIPLLCYTAAPLTLHPDPSPLSFVPLIKDFSSLLTHFCFTSHHKLSSCSRSLYSPLTITLYHALPWQESDALKEFRDAELTSLNRVDETNASLGRSQNILCLCLPFSSLPDPSCSPSEIFCFFYSPFLLSSTVLYFLFHFHIHLFSGSILHIYHHLLLLLLLHPFTSPLLPLLLLLPLTSSPPPLVARENAINSAVALSALNASGNQRGRASSKMRQIHHPLFANLSYKEAEDRYTVTHRTALHYTVLHCTTLRIFASNRNHIRWNAINQMKLCVGWS